MTPELERAVLDAHAAGCRAWPSLRPDPGAFHSHVVKLLGPTADPEHVAALHVDMVLACSCLHGDGDAIRLFDERIIPNARAGARTLDMSSAFIDEVEQLVRHRLLVSDASQSPKLASYAGRGPLGAWVRVVAVRIAIPLLRRGAREQDFDSESVLRLAGSADDLELHYIKAQYVGEFEEAIRGACKTLTKRMRNVLRMRFVDDLNIDQIGLIYQVHRATVARWIAKARETVFEETRRQLERTLKTKISSAEYGSLIRMIRSRLDLSLFMALNDSGDATSVANDGVNRR